MRFIAVLSLLCVAPIGAGAALAQQPSVAAATVADTSRPEADRERDAERKPAVMLVFAGVAPGQRVFEFDPGRGYFTRLFSVAVGSAGRVLAYVPEEVVALAFHPLDLLAAVVAEPGRGNVQPLHYPLAAASPPDIAGTVDLVWTSQNYHDFHNLPGFDALTFNRHVLGLLKPGGVFVVLDHSALPGASPDTTHTLHRIDKALVRHEVEAAGFVFDGESDALANPADPRTALVTDPTIRGHTDQFVLRFRKPR